MNYLVSYPRSGNTWIRYCLENLTGNRTVGYGNATEFEPSILKHTRDLPPWLIKKHETEGINKEDKIILVIRNYKEVLIRQLGKNFNLLERGKDTGRFKYFGLIDFYDKHKGAKHLVYYEDIISYPKETIKKILSFLEFNINKKDLDNFFDNLEKHKQYSLNLYSDSKTQGNDLIYHSSILSLEEKKEWDRYIEKNFENIFTKYLIKYKEIN